MLDNKSYYSVSFWANIEPGSVRNNPLRLTGLYGHSQYMPFVGQNTNWGLLTIETNGIWFEMRNGVSRLHAGRYSYANHVNGVPHYPASTNISGIDIERTLDDGLWHHYLMTMSSAVVTLYIDGILAATATYTNPAITGAPYTSVNFGRLHGPNPTLSPTPPSGTDTKTRGRLDRLRIWHSVLTATDALTLYREDADHDGLWDITESRTALWRDTNSDATRSPGESPFFVNPFIFDPPGLDHDRDGIASIDEQSLGSAIFDADSDDDGIPDGYDQRWCSGATTPDASLDSDADGDGLTLAQELAYGSNPNAPDSDADGTGDAVEVAQGSHPALPGDAGQPPAPGATYAMTLAVGDQSGSDSEDYHLVAYRYDPGTRQETEIFRLRSGGFGQYSGDQTIPIFRRDEQYTFRIQWQGSRLSYRAANPYQGITAEGPDFDYTMKVEPAVPVPGLVIEDAIDPATDQAIPDRTLAGDYSDVTDFPAFSYQAAVKATKTYIDLAVDCSMDGRIDSLPDDALAAKTLGYAYSRADQPTPALPLDRTYENQNPPRPVVIDINNDNSNLDSTIDCDNTTIDSAEDRYHQTGTPLRFRCHHRQRRGQGRGQCGPIRRAPRGGGAEQGCHSPSRHASTLRGHPGSARGRHQRQNQGRYRHIHLPRAVVQEFERINLLHPTHSHARQYFPGPYRRKIIRPEHLGGRETTVAKREFHLGPVRLALVVETGVPRAIFHAPARLCRSRHFLSRCSLYRARGEVPRNR